MAERLEATLRRWVAGKISLQSIAASDALLSRRFKSERKPSVFAQAIAGLVYDFPLKATCVLPA